MGKGTCINFGDLQGNRAISKTGTIFSHQSGSTAAVSISANIAEDCGKDSDAELKRYFSIAMGSSSELEYLLLLAHDLGYLQSNIYQAMQIDLVEMRKMLNAFIQRLKVNR